HSLVISPHLGHNAPLSKMTKTERFISVGYFLLQTNHSLVISPHLGHNAPLSKMTKTERFISVGYFLL
ncbi:hypothetical protein C5F57_30040, partial [Escherichia coli]